MDGPTPGRPTRQERQHRRSFIRAHHPDVGGDPEILRRGLQTCVWPGIPPVTVTGVRRANHPLATALRLWRRRRQRRVAPRVR